MQSTRTTLTMANTHTDTHTRRDTLKDVQAITFASALFTSSINYATGK